MIKSDFAYKVYENTIDVNNFVIDLMPNVTFGDGTTRSDNGQLLFSQVGADKLYSSEYISDYDFAAGFVAIYHENRHVEQLDEIHNSDEEYTKPLKYSYYAMQCCADYGMNNYFNSPREIEAELYGVYWSHHDLCNIFGREKADFLICNYMNERVEHDVSFVHPKQKYTSVDDIFTDLADAYEASITSQRTYDNVESKYGLNFAKSLFDVYPRLLRTMKHNVGWKQDRILSGIYLNQKQNSYIRDSYHGLSSVDWDFDTIFREPGLSERLSVRFPKLYGSRDKSRGKIAEELMNRVVSWQPYVEDIYDDECE